MGESDGRTYALCMLDIPPWALVCQLIPPLPSMTVWEETIQNRTCMFSLYSFQ